MAIVTDNSLAIDHNTDPVAALIAKLLQALFPILVVKIRHSIMNVKGEIYKFRPLGYFYIPYLIYQLLSLFFFLYSFVYLLSA